MISGIAFTGGYIIYFKFIAPSANQPANWLFGISPEGIGTLGMLLNFAVATVVHKLSGDAPEDIQELVDDLRRPKGAATAISH